MSRVKVILFKSSGKYYTEEEWRIPERVPHANPVRASIGDTMAPIGPWDMLHSPDFRRIDNGSVLVPEQEPWGYPHLLVKYVVTEQE